MLKQEEISHVEDAIRETLRCGVVDDTRKRRMVDARKLLSWFLLRGGMTLDEVGKIVGKHHSTVCYYRKVVDGLLLIGDRLTKVRISDISEKIKETDIKNKESMNKKVYISGAIAHHDLEERREAFGSAERFLMLKGFDPVNPFKNGLPADAHWREHMRADIALLLGCDCIYMLRGWELSKGAKLELDVASSCGIEVLFENQFNL